ncbi:hypothetical protein J2Z75_004793 [Rhizobium herbae]|uniref:Uncharacterized protein n=1 Tax=Rhizobium herbae TaxID=508661 RepID=A0ABS4ETJ4_9HYPH|nr:hypothetical protein [Rhizobium herbae]
MNVSLEMNQNVTIQLTLAEALILSDCLGRLNAGENLAQLVDNAEQMALWTLDNRLEAWNPVIFSDRYDKYLQDAKSFITRGTDE